MLPSDSWRNYFNMSGALAMATLTTNMPRAYELGDDNHIPMIAADIIYEGAAVGIVSASGHARPLTSADAFAGFAKYKVDNSEGAAAAKNIEVVKRGQVELSIASLAITDIGAAVYASDDDTFTLSSSSTVFIGFVKRFVSSGVGVVEFNAGVLSA